MTRRRPLHLLREVLDHEVVDRDNVSCGVVDDLELHWSERGPSVVALLMGPGAWIPRLPKCLHAAAYRIFGAALVRVPWSDVAQVEEVIRLNSPARAWGAGRLDERTARWIARLPMS